MKLHNRKYMKSYRKRLRNYGTSAEAVLWNRLKNKQVNGYKFRRQHSIGNYILDFYCPALKLSIELDGQGHVYGFQVHLDLERDAVLKTYGIHTLSFENKFVFDEPESIIQEILDFAKQRDPNT